ncbi:hypothetical protein QVG61_08525 [Thiohalobacter sp. IOR34]|uniref:hypothetical protein n=1 Tax=Thiohalobacter sp. IOR34 TaxID=3057176 RepID=UPI0025B1F593|nr:hypothetical protein [Thiohalobacter sp. IOR34]WJW74551.1 hypothetical protein QVG61_08525 [Thiohalobacter sp. IOR34]
MADFHEIGVPPPVTPVRSNPGVKEKRRPTGEKRRQPRQPERRPPPDDGRPHIDDYA